MKSLALSTFVAMTMASSAFAKTSDVAQGQFSVKALRSIAEETSTVELPAAAVDVILDAPEADRERIAVRTVRIFLTSKHSLAPSLVGAIAANAPEIAPAVVEAAIQLFPENAYAITRAAVSAAPEYSVAIALRSVKAFPERAGSVVAGVQRGNPAGAETFGNFVQAVRDGGQRVFSEDDAIVTFKYTIGSSSQATGDDVVIEVVVDTDTGEASIKAPVDVAVEQKVFLGVEAKETVVNGETVVVFEEQTTVVTAPDGTTTEVPVTVAPESKIGVEITGADAFDIISRVLDTNSVFVKEVVVEAYTQ